MVVVDRRTKQRARKGESERKRNAYNIQSPPGGVCVRVCVLKGKGQKSTLDLKQFSEHPWSLASSGLTVWVLGVRSRVRFPLVGSAPQG